MVKKLAAAVVVLAVLAAATFWFLTAPRPLEAAALPAHEADLENGERMFIVGGCANCHAAPKAKGEERLKLGGGLELATDFGTFRVPNISPDEATGIGGWSDIDFVNAMKRGLAPDGSYLYPAFPYISYTRMHVEDMLDLKAYLDTLPAVSQEVAGHDLSFPFNVRRGMGLWNRLNLTHKPVVEVAESDAKLVLGRYLVEGPGHCGECHTPRDAIGGMQRSEWLAGAPNPEGKGKIPNITPSEEGLGAWSEADIAYFFESGFTPDFDSVGGSMVAVQEELAKLQPGDREAIAAYLKAVPPRP
ncbi:cytochrome c [Afifella sp. IM 167]|uniref:c-type cytochrome n=1 Tax=Afifella sp. IM 167 TaxID=2033586 RepID=UPI001CCE090E|nr:cytochrome c [Afifella sp. IM 167]MBZ8133122.1 cytochrome C [Afifella sp. IM 167]